MKTATPGWLKICRTSILTIVVFSFLLLLLNSSGFFEGIKTNQVLSELNLPSSNYSKLIANAQWYDILQYTDSYRWSIVQVGDTEEDRDLTMKAVDLSDQWRSEQVTYNDVMSIMEKLPAASFGLNKLVPKLETSFDAWYFQSRTIQKDGKEKLENKDDLLAFCKETTVSTYSIAFLDKETLRLWHFKLN